MNSDAIASERRSNDLKTVRDAVYGLWSLSLQTIASPNFKSSDEYRDIINNYLDRMIETPAPTEKVDLDDRIIEALRKENEALHLEIDDCHKRLNRWADAHSELISEVELRKENEELKAKLEANEKLMDESADKLIKANAEIQEAFETIKAKLGKAKEALNFYEHSWVNQSYGSDDGKPSRRLLTDRGQRARTTLEEI